MITMKQAFASLEQQQQLLRRTREEKEEEGGVAAAFAVGAGASATISSKSAATVAQDGTGPPYQSTSFSNRPVNTIAFLITALLLSHLICTVHFLSLYPRP